MLVIQSLQLFGILSVVNLVEASTGASQLYELIKMIHSFYNKQSKYSIDKYYDSD